MFFNWLLLQEAVAAAASAVATGVEGGGGGSSGGGGGSSGGEGARGGTGQPGRFASKFQEKVKQIKPKMVAYSTAMESIQAQTEPIDEEEHLP